MVLVVKNLPANAGNIKRCWFNPWFRKIPWRRAWQPTPIFLLGKSHGQRSLADYSPKCHKELDMTKHAKNIALIEFYLLLSHFSRVQLCVIP